MLDLFRRKAVGLSLVDAKKNLESCRSVSELVTELVTSVCKLADADGVTVTERQGDEATYISSDVILPLMAGRSFPLPLCITGEAMIERMPIVVVDVLQTANIPLNAYLATYVRSMVAVPIGSTEPKFAIGAYWHRVHLIPPATVDLLTDLAASAATALDHILGPTLVPSRRAA